MFYDTGYCRRYAPQLLASNNPSPWAWPKVDGALGWCGEGKKADTGAPYTAGPSYTDTGTINGNFVVVTNSNVTPASAIAAWPTTIHSGTFVQFNISAGNGQFTLYNVGGAIDADFSYIVTNG